MNGIKFEAARLANEINESYLNVVELFNSNNQETVSGSLKNTLDKIGKEDKIKVAFIGQYTAGKSSMISALSGNNNIKIDSDISTSKSKSYEWSGILLTDTPGLYTENKEHDEITRDTIRESDLLVYCITSDLFNEYTLADFKKWAYEHNYSEKLFLAVNKMSKENGEFTTLVTNYTKTLNNSLTPHTINEFENCFIDTKDYRDGVKEKNNDLVECSNFHSFIETLNTFINRKGQLAKLDTPIKAIKEAIDEVITCEVGDEKTKAYLTILNRLSKRVEHKRAQTVSDINSLINSKTNLIIAKGYDLSRSVGVEDIKFSDLDCHELITQVCTMINDEIQNIFNKNLTELAEETYDVLQSDTAEVFFNQVSDVNIGGKSKLFESKSKKNESKQVSALMDLVEKTSSGTVKLATNSGADVGAGLLKATQSSGSTMHNVVLNVGHKIGHKFKPWEAAKFAKNIGNVAKFVGPALSVVSFLMDVKGVVDDEKKFIEIQRGQEQYKQTFREIANDIKEQYVPEIKNYSDVFTSTINNIDSLKTNTTQSQAKNNKFVKGLKENKSKLNELQNTIFST